MDREGQVALTVSENVMTRKDGSLRNNGDCHLGLVRRNEAVTGYQLGFTTREF